MGELSRCLLFMLVACGCSRGARAPVEPEKVTSVPPAPERRQEERQVADQRPGTFRIAEVTSNATGGTRYLAQSGSNCAFEIVIAKPKSQPASPFAFTAATLARRPRADCRSFLEGLASELGFKGKIPASAPVDQLKADLAILGTNQSKADPNLAGSFSSTPPGHWMAAKLFVADGEGEVFLNLNARHGIGEFSPKDEDYAAIVVRELAKVLLPGAA